MQRDLTLLCAVTGNWQALEQLLRAAGDGIQNGTPDNLQPAFDAVTPLHFLSMFVIQPEDGNPAYLVLEASFDCGRDELLDRLMQTNAQLLRDAFAYCADCPPAGDDARLRAYLDTLSRESQLFYVGCPGLTTQRIAEDNELAQEVTGCIRALNQPLGRRSQIVREVWQSLTAQSRARVLNTPPRPAWVRHQLYQRPWSTLMWYAQWPLLVIGWLALLSIAFTPFREHFADWFVHLPSWVVHLLVWLVNLPAWPVAPDSVVSATWCWTRVFLWLTGALSLIWFLISVGEFPDDLASRTRRYVIGVKLTEYIRVTVYALPGLGALLGLLGLLHWIASLLAESERLRYWAWFASWVVIGAIVITALVWIVRVVRIGALEPDDTVDELTWDPVRMTELRRREDRLVQNHLASVTTIRAGPLRLVTLWCVLNIGHYVARVFYNPRGLFNTQSIHFARWLVIPGGRLMFLSNYDGNFGGYLGIFATLGAEGVSAIWTNTELFPRGFLLFYDGARDEQLLKTRARHSQQETLLWYRRYPDLSVATIERNAAIREQLARFSRQNFQVQEAELDAFLRQFSAVNP